jgi:prepilin-type N-terminal cleavage/methylation domain-containing protein
MATYDTIRSNNNEKEGISHGKKAFILIELIVVMAILSILVKI